jgi:hypothetical protein
MYELGQNITAHIEDNGTRIKADVYSIDDTSFVEAGTFVRRFTIRLINLSGEVYSWYEVENPINITLQRSHETLTSL